MNAVARCSYRDRTPDFGALVTPFRLLCVKLGDTGISEHVTRERWAAQLRAVRAWARGILSDPERYYFINGPKADKAIALSDSVSAVFDAFGIASSLSKVKREAERSIARAKQATERLENRESRDGIRRILDSSESHLRANIRGIVDKHSDDPDRADSVLEKSDRFVLRMLKIRECERLRETDNEQDPNVPPHHRRISGRNRINGCPSQCREIGASMDSGIQGGERNDPERRAVRRPEL